MEKQAIIAHIDSWLADNTPFVTQRVVDFALDVRSFIEDLVDPVEVVDGETDYDLELAGVGSD